MVCLKNHPNMFFANFAYSCWKKSMNDKRLEAALLVL